MKCLVQGPMCGKWSINVWDDGEENDDEEAILFSECRGSPDFLEGKE